MKRMLAMVVILAAMCGSRTVAQTTQPAANRGGTGLVLDARYMDHVTSPGHPERPDRVKAIEDGLREAKLLDRCVRIQPATAEVKWVETVHDTKYVQKLAGAFKAGDRALTPDTPISEKSYQTALLAAGGAMAAVDAVADGRARNAFCVIRPPGHHASSDRGMGFCLFNNVAIAARYAQQKHKLARVLIVDWDVHHGNGTQAIFDADPTVFYFSVHRDPFYPGTGHAEDSGVGKAAGTKLNVPMPRTATGAEYLAAFRDKLAPAADKFKPDLVLISCGFDAREDDPLGGMNLNDATYAEMTRIVRGIADKHAQGRLVSMLEGGYNLTGIGQAAAAHVQALMVPTSQPEK